MTMLAYHHDLLAYDLWANRRVVASLESLSGAEEAVKLLCHILGARNLWLNRILGVAGGTPAPTWSLAECAVQAEQSFREWGAFLDRVGPEGIAAVAAYHSLAGDPFESTIGDILTHVSNHSTYHRAQIARIVKGLGGVPAVTDFIAFARERQP